MMPHNNQPPQSDADIRAAIINEETNEVSMGMLIDEVDTAYNNENELSTDKRRVKVTQLIETFMTDQGATA